MIELARVLLVGRENDIGFFGRRKFKTHGINIVGHTDSGEKAIELYTETDPDFLISEYILDGEMDGLELADELKKDRDIPFILISDLLGEHLLEKAEKVGPAKIMLKPVNTLEMVSAIHDVIQHPEIKMDTGRFKLT